MSTQRVATRLPVALVVACVAVRLLGVTGVATAQDVLDTVDLALNRSADYQHVTTVLVARSDDFADSMASSFAQLNLGAPLLLTAPDALDPRTADELDRLDPDTVVILGGPAAVSEDVQADLESRGFAVERLAGEGRVETAVVIANRFTAGQQYYRVVIARAFADPEDPTRAWADSLAAGAHAANVGMPLLLTDSDSLSGATRDYLVGHDVQEAVVAGGTSAISDDVVDQLQNLGIGVQRLAGADRFETAVAMGVGSRSFYPPIIVTDGTDPRAWADGFSAALHFAGSDGFGLYLVDGERVPIATRAILVGSDGLGGGVPQCSPLVASATCDDLAASGSMRTGVGEPIMLAASGGAAASVVLARSSVPGTLCVRVEADPAVVTQADIEGIGTFSLERLPAMFDVSAGTPSLGCAGDLDHEQLAALDSERRTVTLTAADGTPVGGESFIPSGYSHISSLELAMTLEVFGLGAEGGTCFLLHSPYPDAANDGTPIARVEFEPVGGGDVATIDLGNRGFWAGCTTLDPALRHDILDANEYDVTVRVATEAGEVIELGAV